MRLLTWSLRLFIFLFLFAFAVMNTEMVSLRFFFDTAWQAPLVVVLLAFFAGGALLGIFAMLGLYFRQRREISRLQQAVRTPSPAEISLSE